MNFVTLDLQNEKMLMTLLPVYQTYEAEISKEILTDIFPPDRFEENYAYFLDYFSEGYTTYIYETDGAYQGFVCCHLDCEYTPGYAEGYHGWGHIAEIYVYKKSRKTGLGKILVKKAEDELKKLGITKIYLTDISDNGGFWESQGYTNTGKIEPNEGGKIFEKFM